MKRLLTLVSLLVVLSVSVASAQTALLQTQYVTANSAGGDCSTAGSCAIFPVTLETLAVDVSGTFSGTLTFEATVNGARWDTVQARKASDGSTATTATAPGTYSIPNVGFKAIRARATSWSSGQARVDATAGLSTATTFDAPLGCYLQSAASTNATTCKASAGNFYGVRAVNTTATLYYLRLYNLAANPTCSSATGFIESIPIPASATGAGIMAVVPIPIAYSTGIAFCFTGGGSSTDNTNAATGVYLAIYYK